MAFLCTGQWPFRVQVNGLFVYRSKIPLQEQFSSGAGLKYPCRNSIRQRQVLYIG